MNLEKLIESLWGTSFQNSLKAEQTPEFWTWGLNEDDVIQTILQETGVSNEEDLKFEIRSMKQRVL